MLFDLDCAVVLQFGGAAAGDLSPSSRPLQRKKTMVQEYLASPPAVRGRRTVDRRGLLLPLP